MFTAEELNAIDTKYFTVIVANEYDVTLMSKCTHHLWYMHSVELPDRGCKFFCVYGSNKATLT